MWFYKKKAAYAAFFLTSGYYLTYSLYVVDISYLSSEQSFNQSQLSAPPV